MLAHLKQCPGCSDLYVRLKLLHEELAQLPKVKPAYSIVDAILPQLEEMPLWSTDSAEGPETSAAAKEQVVSLPQAQVRRGRRGLISWRVFSGVAAAGIIIGLFLSNQDNFSGNKSASESVVMENRAGAPQSASVMGKSATDLNKGAQPLTEGANQDTFRVVPTQSEVAAASTAPSATPAAAPELSLEPKDASGRVTMASPTDSFVKEPFGLMQQFEAGDSDTVPGSASAPLEGKQDQLAEHPESGGSTTGSSLDAAQEEGHLSFTLSDQVGKSKTSGEPEQGEAAASVPRESDAKRMDIQSLAGTAAAGAPAPQASPDGLYTAFVADGKVTINNKEGESVFISSILLGPEVQVRFGEWADAHTFSYTVRTVSGTETTYVISAAKGKEWKK
jgi:hypothetical protein